ncbi:MAG: catecholate siderophore receptor Fiu [Burkholderiaceae bacterium]
MSYIKSRKHAAIPSRLRQAPAVAALATTLAVPIAVQAQTAAQPSDRDPAASSSSNLPPVRVEARRETPYKVDNSSSVKATAPLLDTPRTVQVLDKELLREQGATTLMEALRNTPGITMQLGENGSTSMGDTFQLRGFASQSQVLVDGLRDLGGITRDVYNYDSIEIVKGPAGAEVGRAAASGYVNLFTKLPQRASFTDASLSLGSGNRKRLSADTNHAFGENAAFRFNAMIQDSGVPGRHEVENKGWAIAPSVAFGLNTPTRIYLYSQHQRHDNVPDGGIPSIGWPGFYNANAALANGGRVDRHNFYGSNHDFEKFDIDSFTAKIEHQLSPTTRIHNITRYSRNSIDRMLTGIFTLAAPGADSSSWTISRLLQRVDQTNESIVNQTNLSTELDTGGLKHNLAGGVELIYESQRNRGSGTAAQTIRGVDYAAVVNTPANLYNPNPGDPIGVPYWTGIDVDGKTVTTAAYLFDTVTINESFKLNGGLRFEHYKTTTNSGTLVTATNVGTYPGYAAGGVAPYQLERSDNMTSWNLGAVYKPAANGSIYASYANSQTPPGGANFVLSATANNQNDPGLAPQKTKSAEIGTKWDLLDRRLNVAGALFRLENEGQVSTDPFTGLPVQFGKTRVDGVELSSVGQITTNWFITAAVTRMKAKQLDQISVSGGNITETTGVRWSPDWMASLWSTYRMGPLTVGGGVRYVSEQKRVITGGTNLATQNMPEIPSYWVADLMAAYQVTKNVNLRLNVYNLFDKDYIQTLNNSGARMTLGMPRAFMVTANAQF